MCAGSGDFSPGAHVDDNSDVVVICGFGVVGQTIAKSLQNSQTGDLLLSDKSSGREANKYIAFDLDPEEVVKGHKNGFRVMYGDGSQPLVLNTAGVQNPKAFAVTFADSELIMKTVEKLRFAFPAVPIFARYRLFLISRVFHSIPLLWS